MSTTAPQAQQTPAQAQIYVVAGHRFDRKAVRYPHAPGVNFLVCNLCGIDAIESRVIAAFTGQTPWQTAGCIAAVQATSNTKTHYNVGGHRFPTASGFQTVWGTYYKCDDCGWFADENSIQNTVAGKAWTGSACAPMPQPPPGANVPSGSLSASATNLLTRWFYNPATSSWLNKDEDEKATPPLGQQLPVDYTRYCVRCDVEWCEYLDAWHGDPDSYLADLCVKCRGKEKPLSNDF